MEDTTLQITDVLVVDLSSSGLPISLFLHVSDGTLFVQTDVINGVTAAQISGEGTNSITIIGQRRQSMPRCWRTD